VRGDTHDDLARELSLEGDRIFFRRRGGRVWLAASNGLVALEESPPRFFPLPAEDPSAEIAGAHEDRDGIVWLATRGGGLRRFDGRRLVTLDTRHGLPSAWIAHVEDDDDGRLWASGAHGLFWARREDLRAVAEGRRREVAVATFGDSDGVPTGSHRLGTPSGFRDGAGRLWFATRQGVLGVSPATLQVPVPHVRLVEVRLAGRPADPAGPLEATAPADLEVALAAPTFTGGPISFRYRMDGVDADWLEAGARGHLRYDRLPAGTLRLRVQARGRDGRLSAEEASLTVRLQPPFHRTGWFAGLAGLALVSLGVGAQRARLRLQRRQHEALTRERARIARDVHDTLAQAFVATSAQLECLRHALTRGDRTATERHLEAARQVVKDSLEEARRSIWVLRPQALEGGLTGALEALARLSSGAARLEFSTSGPARRLAPGAEASLLRIAQEAVSNALKHGAAGVIRIELRWAPRSVALTVTDDGRGLGAGGGDGFGMGLVGMEERAAELGGALTIGPGPDGGTRVQVEVPT
jgi:signal transduction histidine kinase